MPGFDYNGLSVRYVEVGSGEPVVLLHAGASSGNQWRKLSDRLQDAYRLISPDLIGFGQTPVWPGPSELTHDDQAGLVRELIDTTGAGSVHLVGHSYGGATAVRLLVAEPSIVRTLVLIEPILTPLLPQAGDHELFNEYVGFARDLSSRRRADTKRRHESPLSTCGTVRAPGTASPKSLVGSSSAFHDRRPMPSSRTSAT